MKRTNMFFLSLWIVTVSIITLRLITCFVYPIFGPDSGYYSAIARMLYSGNIYFTEIAVPYNPLSLSLFGLPFLFSAYSDLRWSLLINTLVIAGSAVILFKILTRHVYSEKKINVFFSLFFVLLSLVFVEGQLMLEPVSVFFQLVALYIYLGYRDRPAKKHLLFFTGILISLSFLAKQFGLFLLLPVGLDILIRKRHLFFKEALALLGGCFIPVLLLYAYYACKDVPASMFIRFILGKGTAIDTGSGTGSTYTFTYFLTTFTYFLLFNAYLFIIPFLLILFRKKIKMNQLIFIILPCSSFLVLFFAAYFHYYLYIIPYCVILCAFLMRFITKNSGKILFYVSFVLSVGLIGIFSFLKLKDAPEQHWKQQQAVKIFNKNIPSGSEVFLAGPSQSFYGLCNFNSINLSRIGFSFPNYFYPETIVENMNKNAFLVLNDKYKKRFQPYLNDFTVKYMTIENSVYFIYQKKK